MPVFKKKILRRVRVLSYGSIKGLRPREVLSRGSGGGRWPSIWTIQEQAESHTLELPSSTSRSPVPFSNSLNRQPTTTQDETSCQRRRQNLQVRLYTVYIGFTGTSSTYNAPWQVPLAASLTCTLPVPSVIKWMPDPSSCFLCPIPVLSALFNITTVLYSTCLSVYHERDPVALTLTFHLANQRHPHTSHGHITSLFLPWIYAYTVNTFISSEATFKKHLKTFLFHVAFN